MRQHVQHVLTLAGLEGVDAEIHGDLRADVEQHARESLRAMGSSGDPKGVVQVRVSLKIDFASVDGKDTTTMPASVFIEIFPQQILNMSKQLCKQVVLDLVSGHAEGRCSDCLFLGQRQLKGSSLIPESFKEEVVPSAIAIGNHVEDESEEKLG
jgi:hypothetical protein